jgi:hypothetical protein
MHEVVVLRCRHHSLFLEVQTSFPLANRYTTAFGLVMRRIKAGTCSGSYIAFFRVNDALSKSIVVPKSDEPTMFSCTGSLNTTFMV